ncbi:oxidoreductase, short chain dehydrogenase/reductase family protein [Brugia malayi]|uniref:Fatty acid synthase n=1 Tax=Brugia malayi TaxID=6279 RepID=A0A4E9F532_BRUMA|nr:oxidoreductase, short chain dehydrogenase/reductase family protein [Brugia malayi]VIO90960.1 oxidoreductase, short chain dehydrogenase/reductase family protein [Brugia malayi]
MSTLVELFRKAANQAELKSKIVVCDGDTKWTLAELDTMSEKLAKHFVEKYGAKRGDCIGIYMNKCAFYALAYTAALKAGCAYLPLDVFYPQPLLIDIITEIKPVVICSTPDIANSISDLAPMYVFGSSLPNPSQSIKLPEIGPDDRAYIVYSSGTTGKPKGIECPHRGAAFSYEYRFVKYPYVENEREACNVFFVWELFRPILQGVEMYVIPDNVIYDLPELCRFLSTHKITRMMFTPSLLEAVLDTHSDETIRSTFRTFRTILLCGEVVTYLLLKRILDILPKMEASFLSILNLYSISECHDVSYSNLTEVFYTQPSRKYAPVGKVIPGVKVHVIDVSEGLKEVPMGVPGEIFVGGPALAIGYINRPELNQHRFITVPDELRDQLGDRLYRTGDWGYLLPNSVLEICGRCDTMVKIRGYSIEILAVESVILELPYVKSCVVISVGAEGDDKQLAAYVVLKENVTRKQMRADLKKQLPFYMVPTYFVYLASLPVVPASSKVDKKALPPVDQQKDAVEASALPKTATEERLAKIWAEVLSRTAVDIQESFFDLGGHSLMAARLLHKIEEEFGIQLNMRELFATPTVSSLARRIDHKDDSDNLEHVDLAHQVNIHDFKDNVMDLHLRAFWRSTDMDYSFSRDIVLLTGVTGFIGSHILVKLLLTTEMRVICLIRESAGVTTQSRLIDSIEKMGMMTNTLNDLIRSRVKIISGDVALIRLGLSEEEYLFLTYEVDIVIHAAAYVNLIFPYQALHGINVLGTRNILDFCHQNKVKPLYYLSTDAVIPSNLKDVDEDITNDDVQGKLMNGYAQTKWVAERLVINSQVRGLPTVIFRLGNQAASMSTGRWNNQDFIYLLIFCSIQSKMAPDLDWVVEFTPVDFTSSFITQILTKSFRASMGKIFHLTNSNGPTWRQIVNWINDFGIPMRLIPLQQWVQLISTNEGAEYQQLHKLLQVMVKDDTFFGAQSMYKRTNTEKVLKDMGGTYPVVTKRKATVGKVCIVTGASTGIGEAIVRELALIGYMKVVFCARRRTKLMELVSKLEAEGCMSSNLLPVACDITQMSDIQFVVSRAVETYGTIDVLVNNAGCMYYEMMKNGPTKEWNLQIDVNCRGTMNCIGAVLPHMIKAGSGHIVNITSDAGKRGFAGLAVYSGTKFFIEGMSQALRLEMVEHGIRVTNVQPGDVETEISNYSTDKEACSKYDVSKAGHPILSSSDVARAVLYAVNQPSSVAVNEILIEPQATPI